MLFGFLIYFYYFHFSVGKMQVRIIYTDTYEKTFFFSLYPFVNLFKPSGTTETRVFHVWRRRAFCTQIRSQPR